MSASVKYLGHRIDSDGIHAMDSKLEIICEAPIQLNIQKLCSFLRLLNYYASFITNLSSLILFLNLLLHQILIGNCQNCEVAFNAAKARLLSSNLLVHYDPILPIRMAGGASPYGIGAILSYLMPNGVEQPIAFASRTLSISNSNNAQLEKEVLALIFEVR